MSNPYIGSELKVSGVEVYELQEDEIVIRVTIRDETAQKGIG